jgi:hypothetical protein
MQRKKKRQIPFKDINRKNNNIKRRPRENEDTSDIKQLWNGNSYLERQSNTLAKEFS